MSNSRRQTIIIAVLIVLIAVAGVFAKKFNENVQDVNSTNTGTTSDQDKVSSMQELRVSHENEMNALKQEYEQIINNQDQTKEAKDQANKKYMALLDQGDEENTVETKVMENGFDDAVCIMNDNGVEMYVKTSEHLTNEQAAQVMDIIVRTTKISPSNIVIKESN